MMTLDSFGVRTWLTSALCLMTVQTGCSQETSWSTVHAMVEARFPGVPQVTTDSLARRMQADAPTLLLDARTPEEYAVSHIPGAVRIDPSAPNPASIDALDRDQPVVVYCSVGYRSARVAAMLRERGYDQVSNLRGSIFQWANEGRRVVRGSTTVRQVHPYDASWGRLLDPALHADLEDISSPAVTADSLR